jgi:hypothetical protein
MGQQGIDIDPVVGQQAVHLLDRMLGQPSASKRQTLADQADRQRRGLDHPQSGACQRQHALGMQICAEQRVHKAVDTFKGKRPMSCRDRVPCGEPHDRGNVSRRAR